jgi:flagellar biosynthesis chaperone FliJ
MGLTSKQIESLAHKMVKHAEQIALRMQEGISTQDIEKLQHWRDVIAQQVARQCVAVYELNAVIDAAQRVVDLKDTERVAVATLRIALILAAAAGALLEVGRMLSFVELFNEC